MIAEDPCRDNTIICWCLFADHLARRKNGDLIWCVLYEYLIWSDPIWSDLICAMWGSYLICLLWGFDLTCSMWPQHLCIYIYIYIYLYLEDWRVGSDTGLWWMRTGGKNGIMWRTPPRTHTCGDRIWSMRRYRDLTWSVRCRDLICFVRCVHWLVATYDNNSGHKIAPLYVWLYWLGITFCVMSVSIWSWGGTQLGGNEALR